MWYGIPCKSPSPEKCGNKTKSERGRLTASGVNCVWGTALIRLIPPENSVSSKENKPWRHLTFILALKNNSWFFLTKKELFWPICLLEKNAWLRRMPKPSNSASMIRLWVIGLAASKTIKIKLHVRAVEITCSMNTLSFKPLRNAQCAPDDHDLYRLLHLQWFQANPGAESCSPYNERYQGYMWAETSEF